MRLVLIISLLVVLVFSAAYWITADIWLATNAAGVICIGFMTSIAVHIIRLFPDRKRRLMAICICAIGLSVLVLEWTFIWRQSQAQYEALISTRRAIFHQETMETLESRAVAIFSEYCRNRGQTTVGDTFNRLYPPGSSVIDSLMAVDIGNAYSNVSDSTVRLVVVAHYVTGFDSTFLNQDGRRGLAQYEATISTAGIGYDIQN